MKYCPSCKQRRPDSSERCRVCDRPLVHDYQLTDEQRSEIATLCCSNRECDELVASPGTYFCKACGKALEPISIEAWEKKFLGPAFEEDPRDVLAFHPRLFTRADEMGLERREVTNSINRLIATRSGVDPAEVNEWVKEATAILMSRAADLEHLTGQARKLAGTRKIAPSFSSHVLDTLLKASTTMQLPGFPGKQEDARGIGNHNPNDDIETKKFTSDASHQRAPSGVASDSRQPSSQESGESTKREQASRRENSKGDFSGSESEQAAHEDLTDDHRKKNWHLKFFVVTLVVSLIVLLWSFWGSIFKRKTVVEAIPPVQAATPVPSPSVSPSPQNMALIPGEKTFYMGNDDGKEEEKPSHPEPVDPFYLDQYEVSREQYSQCVDDLKCKAPDDWKNGLPRGTEKLPVTKISWNDAKDFCKWKGKRLPTEAEWEYAARGKERRQRYPWGEEWIEGRANIASEGPNEVGKYKQREDLNLYDLIGNVWEWTADEFKVYPGSTNQSLNQRFSGARVIRGGAWNSKKDAGISSTYRGVLFTTRAREYYADTGFRCAKSLP